MNECGMKPGRTMAELLFAASYRTLQTLSPEIASFLAHHRPRAGVLGSGRESQHGRSPHSDLPQRPSSSDNTAHVPEHCQAPARACLRARISNLHSNFTIRYTAITDR